MAAGDATEEVTVGWDNEFSSTTFDSDAYDPDTGAVGGGGADPAWFATLDGLDPDWRTHLREAE